MTNKLSNVAALSFVHMDFKLPHFDFTQFCVLVSIVQPFRGYQFATLYE